MGLSTQDIAILVILCLAGIGYLAFGRKLAAAASVKPVSTSGQSTPTLAGHGRDFVAAMQHAVSL